MARQTAVSRALVVLVLCGALVACVAPASAVRPRQARNSSLVLTPFGWHHASCVHGVPDGAVVTNHADHLLVEHESLPGGVQRVARCGIPLGSAVPRANAGSFDDDDSGTAGNGWQAYTEDKIDGTIDSFLGRWTVPPEPQQEAQTLFTFTGLQNINWVPPNPQPGTPFDIIQPVLQYGSSSAGAFDAWSIASWYVTLGSDVVFSKLKQINAGDKLFGNMTRVGTDSWFINAVDETSGITSGVTVKRSILSAQPWAYVTLEVYDVDDCEQFPTKGTPMPYTDLALVVEGKPRQFQWSIGSAGQSPPVCGAKASIQSSAEVTITW